ncbi:hypothetical protein ACUY3U_15485 [Gordonia amicalis]|nr:hypothetical protein BPODLACK_03899 [Gordonia sp. YY1]
MGRPVVADLDLDIVDDTNRHPVPVMDLPVQEVDSNIDRGASGHLSTRVRTTTCPHGGCNRKKATPKAARHSPTKPVTFSMTLKLLRHPMIHTAKAAIRIV